MTDTPGWVELGACTGGKSGLDFFDPHAANVRACKAVCAGCQGRPGCLAFAMEQEQNNDNNRWGVWGGKTPLERIRLAARRAKVRR